MTTKSCHPMSISNLVIYPSEATAFTADDDATDTDTDGENTLTPFSQNPTVRKQTQLPKRTIPLPRATYHHPLNIKILNTDWKQQEQRKTTSHAYECTQCPRVFNKLHYLNAHLVTHSSNFAFCCTFSDCFAKFRRSQDLRRHCRLESHGTACE
ncbi:hypothetical protein BDR26DRAFT_875710 [Obelidium mucronatum]|nr:hypothetical protein BDR26DRAFT_875710 [Obelidium mucronatum]